MLIVGLGNPGSDYEETRHNIGFKVIDALASTLRATNISKSEFKGELYKSSNIFLLKPTTYMNLSGESVIAVSKYYKIENILVIHDDLDLKFGAIRFKRGGGHGGHNGLKSIDKHCGSDYIRVRLGIDKPTDPRFSVSDYVLGRFNADEQKTLASVIEKAKEAIISLIDGESLEKVTATYSQKQATI